MNHYEGKPQLLALYESGRSAAIANAPRSSAPRFTDCDKYARHLGAWIEGFDDETRKQKAWDAAVDSFKAGASA